MYLFNGICLTDNLVKNLHRVIAQRGGPVVHSNARDHQPRTEQDQAGTYPGGRSCHHPLPNQLGRYGIRSREPAWEKHD